MAMRTSCCVGGFEGHLGLLLRVGSILCRFRHYANQWSGRGAGNGLDHSFTLLIIEVAKLLVGLTPHYARQKQPISNLLCITSLGRPLRVAT